jgi:hypothetical protein
LEEIVVFGRSWLLLEEIVVGLILSLVSTTGSLEEFVVNLILSLFWKNIV